MKTLETPEAAYCENCKFFVASEEAGRCRRYPPQMVSDVSTHTHGFVGDYSESIETSNYSLFPEVDKENWCGEFKKQGDE